MLKSLAQSTIDYLILAGVIMVVIIPLLMFSGNKLDAVRESQIVDAVKIIQNAVVELINLGYGSATERVIQIPTGIISQQILNNILILNFKGQDLKFEFGFNIAGVFPINPGRHYVKLFNNGTHIIFSICGNNIIEEPEQCDGTSFPPIALPPGTTCTGACTLSCGTGGLCPPSYVCVSDICIPTSFCGNNIVEDFEQCDPPSSTPTSECDPYISTPGMGICTTVGGVPCQCENTCGDGTKQSWEPCDPTAPLPPGCTSCTSSCQCAGAPPPVLCGDTFPACGGTCPPGETCTNIGSACACQLTSTCSGSPGSCGGTCPVGQSCVTFGSGCSCQATSSCAGSYPACTSGTCPPGQTCLSNAFGCNCVSVPPINYCGGTLVGYWHLNDGTSGQSPTTALDSSGNNNHGTVEGPPGSWTWVDGSTSLDNFINFINGEARISFNTINLPPEGTVELLFIATAWSAPQANTFMESMLSTSSCIVVTRSGGPIVGGPLLPAPGFTSTTYNPQPSVLYHLAIEWSPMSFAMIINGNLDAGASIGTAVANCGLPLRIAGPNIISSLTGFIGAIEEIILFANNLPLSTVQAHAYRGLSQLEYCQPFINIPCSSTFPACNGECPGTQICQYGGSSAGCICVTPSDCGGSFSTCGGTCLGSESCIYAGTYCACGTPGTCPNGICEVGETCYTCPSDCGVCGGGLSCGDGICASGENCAACPDDCGSCPPLCPNGACDSGETCTNCPDDCGPCCPNGVNDPGEDCDGTPCPPGYSCNLACQCISDSSGGGGAGGGA